MDFELEELLPIVSKLAERYTAFESTSITYEKAEQLMGAVLYCIHEAKISGNDSLISAHGASAAQVYDAGVRCVEEKTKITLELYNEMVSEFVTYGNHCLNDTIINGLPEFFRWYDVKFAPQNTILTLDYPVLKDLMELSGIDEIYEYLLCVCLEQKFLKKFAEEYVIEVLSKYHALHQDMIDNICEIVFMNVLVHILAGKPLLEQKFVKSDYLRVQKILRENDVQAIKNQLKDATARFIREYYEDSDDLLEYLLGMVDNIVIRLKYIVDSDTLYQMF